MKARIQRSPDHLVITLSGDFDAFVREPFLDQVQALLEQDEHHLELDLQRVGFMGSSGVGALLKARRMCRERGGELVLTQVSRAVRETLELLDLTSVLPIVEDGQQARAAAGVGE